MRTVLAIASNFVFFLAAFFLGSFVFHPFHLQTTLEASATHLRLYQWDGLLLMSIAYLLALLLAVSTRKIRGTVAASTIAVLVAGAVGLAMKFGFVTMDR